MQMVAIEIHGLSKRFGDIAAVDDLSFSARAGAVTGFLGPNGAGSRVRREAKIVETIAITMNGTITAGCNDRSTR
jgi:ABC-2 type transport system ATP-binding protein